MRAKGRRRPGLGVACRWWRGLALTERSTTHGLGRWLAGRQDAPGRRAGGPVRERAGLGAERSQVSRRHRSLLARSSGGRPDAERGCGGRLAGRNAAACLLMRARDVETEADAGYVEHLHAGCWLKIGARKAHEQEAS